ncbi:MAG TPA: hypothetical protein DIW81_02115, partial [Planctomycetaceae bacterium]|nr:hypothetical protein [Planctomycetaceae bacterium]
SPRRSYFQIQAGERLPEKDSHLTDQTHLQTHPLVLSAPDRQSQSDHPAEGNDLEDFEERFAGEFSEVLVGIR